MKKAIIYTFVAVIAVLIGYQFEWQSIVGQLFMCCCLVLALSFVTAAATLSFLKITERGGLIGGYQDFLARLENKGYMNLYKALGGCEYCVCFWFAAIFFTLPLIAFALLNKEYILAVYLLFLPSLNTLNTRLILGLTASKI